jgi:PAS domain S-box-containing protein
LRAPSGKDGITMRDIISRLNIFYVDVPALRPGTTGAYLLAFVSVLAATALRLAIDPFVGGLQFATFFPAVILTTLISGLGAGLLSVVLSLAAVAFIVMPPRWSLYVEQPADVLAIVLYAVALLFNVAAISGLRVAVERQHALQAVQASKDRLQFALNSALLGWWQFDPNLGVVWWDPRSKEIYEMAEDWTDIEEFNKRVHPDDIGRVWVAIGAAIDPTNPKHYAAKFRYRRGDGGFRWIEAHGHVEFVGGGRERRAFNMVGTAQDITERKHHEEAQARLAAIVTSSADAIVGKTLDGIVTTWNEGAERMFGYSAGDMIGQSIRRLIPAERHTEEDMILARLAQNKSIVHFETKRVTKDGRTFDASVTISPVHDAEGRVIGAAKIVHDITERKQVEEQVRLLMREANHRAKNMLSLVQAVARQTAARHPEDFVGRFTERLQALAANQDLLVRNEGQGVDVDELARAQLAHFADLVGSRITTHGPKLHLNAAAAQAIGLALHELATNAGKYGALSTEMGRVDISWGRDNDIFTMSWTEREGPPVSAPKRHGFGTTVVEQMAKKSVEGVVELDYAPSGLIWRLTCPAANALESWDDKQILRSSEN